MANPTQNDVARKAGVSRGLVSLALAGSTRVSKDTVARIIAAAEELGYVRDLGAASLAAGASPLIGVLLAELRNPFQDDVSEAIQAHAAANDLLALLATGGHHREREHLIMQRFLELRVSGVVIISPAIGRETLREYAKRVPLATIGVRGVGGLVDSVHMDENAAGVLVAQHAAALGKPTLVHLAFSLRGGQDATVAPRRKAVEAGARAAGLEFTVARTLPEALKLAETGTVAISTHHDLVALELLEALRAKGLEDTPVIGYDDTDLAKHFNLTSVSQRSQTLGRRAMELLQARIADPARPGEDVSVEPTISVRA
jgi:DNA-binding LacI/PurR family transcriptional regulator